MTVTITTPSRRTSPIKLTRFWELYNAFSGPHTNFPLALYHSIQAEQASLRDTGTKVQEKMSWAGDRHLTNILARWVSTERCSSSANCNFNFAQSFSAQRKDQAFGMPFDGLSEQQPASHHRTPRSFASATGYVNPEYTDDMMLECVHRCDQAISEGQADKKTVRNLMFIPFQPGMLIHHTIKTLMRERPNDIRPLIIFPPKTYPFWQLGYWFGINRLRKTIDLCYNDGPVALIAFDNEFARSADPLPVTLTEELAIWRRSKLPTKHIDSIQWLHECAPRRTHPPILHLKQRIQLLTCQGHQLD